MSPFLLLSLLACGGKDTGRMHYSSRCDDSCPPDDTDDTGDVPPVAELELCGDALDNDGDGAIDEAGCVRAWAEGDATVGQLGKSLAVSPTDPTLWAYAGEDADENDHVASAYMDISKDLQRLWALPDEPRTSSQQSMVELDGRRTLVYTTGDRDLGYMLDVAEVPGIDTAGAPPTLISSIGADCDGWDIRAMDAWAEGDQLGVAVGPNCGQVFVAYDLGDETGQLSDRADTVLSGTDTPDNPHAFGHSVLFLPDDGGDGVPDLLVGDPGPDADHSKGSAVYLFDGTLRGSVTTADADAVVSDDGRTIYGEGVQRAGDLDGDGYEDLAVLAATTAVDIWYGPFQGSMSADDVTVDGGIAVAGGFSGDGDDTPDLAVTNSEGEIHLFSGPVQRATYDFDSADYVIPAGDLDWSIRSQMIFADVDADGRNELVVGDPDFGMVGLDPGPGLLLVYDLSAW